MDKKINNLRHSNTFFQAMALIVSTTLFATSCGGGGNKSQSVVFQVGAQMALVENIDNNQRNIATRICYAYQSKNSNFNSSDYLGSKFNFNVNQKTCDAKTTSSSVTAILKKEKDVFIYSANEQNNFYQNVQTNTMGYLSQLCTKINSNQDISNTLDINGNRVQIIFFTDKSDGFKISYFTMDNNNNYKIHSAETFRVRTQLNFIATSILGMDENYTKQEVCNNDSSNFSEIEQRFISHN